MWLHHIGFPGELRQNLDDWNKKYGLCSHRLAATSVLIMTEESVSLLFLACMDRFVSQQHAVPPAKEPLVLKYRAADRRQKRKTHIVFKQNGIFFFLNNTALSIEFIMPL